MQRAATSLLRSLGSRQVSLKGNLREDSWKWTVPMMLGASYHHSNYATKPDEIQSRYSFDDLILQSKAQSSHDSKEPDYQAADGVPHVDKEPVRAHPIGKRISAEEKRKFLVNTLLDLKDSKEVVYGTLDAWVAWEQTFPLVLLKRTLLVLEKQEQWHRIVQVIKWMLSKGQGTTMGTYEQLICALEKDNRPEEAHSIWLFKEIESYGRKPPSKSIVRKVADAYELLGFLDEKNKLLEKYDDLFNSSSREPSRKSRKFAKRGIAAGKKKLTSKVAIDKSAIHYAAVDSGS